MQMDEQEILRFYFTLLYFKITLLNFTNYMSKNICIGTEQK